MQSIDPSFSEAEIIKAEIFFSKLRDKYEKGLVDINTLKRYMNDIISYAEIYGGEYSVTYKDEREW